MSRSAKSLKGILIVMMALVAGVGSAQPVEKVPKDWVQRYHKLQEMVNRKDVRGFLGTFDKSFLQISQRGDRTVYTDYISSMPAFFERNDHLRTRLVPTSCKVRGQDIVLTYEFRVYATNNGKPVDYIEMGTDTWNKVNGKYVIVREEVESLAPLPMK